MNEQTDSSTGRVRETPHQPQTRHTSTGRVRDTHLPTNDKTNSNRGCVTEPPDPLKNETDFLPDEQTVKFEHGACKRDSPPDEGADSF